MSPHVRTIMEALKAENPKASLPDCEEVALAIVKRLREDGYAIVGGALARDVNAREKFDVSPNPVSRATSSSFWSVSSRSRRATVIRSRIKYSLTDIPMASRNTCANRS